MILISVKSEVMDCKRQFEKDIHAETYLKRVKLIHTLQRIQRLRPFGPKMNLNKVRRMKSYDRLKSYNILMSKCIPLKVEIINTNANQLNLQLK